MTRLQRIVIVGAGTAGCVLAARLSERSDREVVLVEDGDWLNRPSTSALRGRGSLALAYDLDQSLSWSVSAGARQLEVRSGRGIGGSSAVNGCYFVRPTRLDLDRWAEIAGPAFSPDSFAGYFERLENDLDFGSAPGHGDAGPVPVERDASDLNPVSAAFLSAATGLGAEFVADLNAPVPPDPNMGKPGVVAGRTVGARIGPVPFNSRDGKRADMATCYLVPVLANGGRRNLSVMTDGRATRLVLTGGRVSGVEVAAGGATSVVAADQVVLCAGAIGSPALLLGSGIGSAEQLSDVGRRSVVDLPGVGQNLFNHPTVDLSYLPTEAAVDARVSDVAGGFMQLALYAQLGRSADTAELMATRQPYGSATSLDPADPELSIRVTLTDPLARGSLRLRPREHPPDPGNGGDAQDGEADSGSRVIVDHDPLASAQDRESFRRAVRLADEVLRSPHFTPLIASRALGVSDVADDRKLDDWISRNVGFAFHPMGTCAMGTDARSVVDSGFAVHGVSGLFVVDASVIPVPLSRGPAATVVALSEAAAQQFLLE